MKLVRVLQSIVAPEFEYQLGEEVEIDDHRAKAWAKSGIVEPIKERSAHPVETAALYPSIHGEFAAFAHPALDSMHPANF